VEQLQALVLVQDVGGDQALLEAAVGVEGGRQISSRSATWMSWSSPRMTMQYEKRSRWFSTRRRLKAASAAPKQAASAAPKQVASAAPNQVAGLVGQNGGRWTRSAGLCVGSTMAATTSPGPRKGLELGSGSGCQAATVSGRRRLRGSPGRLRSRRRCCWTHRKTF